MQGQNMDYMSRIVSDPDICNGQPVIKGTRVIVRTILASLAEDGDIKGLLDDFPTLTEEDVRAVIALAADNARDIPLLPKARR